jgi:Family of unknown function (DUF5677)
MMTERQFFGASLNFSNKVLKSLDTEDSPELIKLAYLALKKSWALCDSIWQLRHIEGVDHEAICSLGRSVIDSTVFGTYLLENVDETELELRLLLIKLNDVQSRINYLQITSEIDIRPHMQNRAFVVAQLEAHPTFSTFSKERKGRFLQGHQPFLHGRQQAAVNAGWDANTYRAAYSMYSDYSHTNPMSVTGTANGNLEFQQSLIDLTLILTARSMTVLAKRLLAKFPEVAATWDKRELEAVDTLNGIKFKIY